MNMFIFYKHIFYEELKSALMLFAGKGIAPKKSCFSKLSYGNGPSPE